MSMPPPPQKTRKKHPTGRQRKKRAQVVKLIVAGLAHSGKTEFIQSVSQYTEWQNQPGKSWFFGRVRVDSSLILHFLEPPMQRQFDFIWLRDVMSRIRATGFITMLDSTRPQHFGEFLSVVYTIRGYHPDAPIIVAANKQDSPHAWSPKDLRLGLGIRDVTIMPCIAYDHDLVREIVIELLYKVLI